MVSEVLTPPPPSGFVWGIWLVSSRIFILQLERIRIGLSAQLSGEEVHGSWLRFHAVMPEEATYATGARCQHFKIQTNVWEDGEQKNANDKIALFLAPE